MNIRISIILIGIFLFSVLAFREREYSLDNQLRYISGQWMGENSTLSILCQYNEFGMCKVSLSDRIDTVFSVSRLRNGNLLLFGNPSDEARQTMMYDRKDLKLMPSNSTLSRKEKYSIFQFFLLHGKYISSMLTMLCLSAIAHRKIKNIVKQSGEMKSITPHVPRDSRRHLSSRLA